MAIQKLPLSYNDYVQGVQMLSPAEQLGVVEVILANLKMVVREKRTSSESKLANLKPHKLIIGDPDELVDIKVWQQK